MVRAGRLRTRWDRESRSYDRSMSGIERRMFPDVRRRLCAYAHGDTLEVAVGTGLNLPHYPPDVRAGRLTGVEWSAGMLDVARRRALDLGVDADLRVGDAQALDLPDASYDSVVCTFSLCAITDHEAALAEMVRVLRPGGLLLLADHVESTSWPIRAAQGAAELVSVPLQGEHFRRRPMRWLETSGLAVEHHERSRHGVIEWEVARRPARPGR